VAEVDASPGASLRKSDDERSIGLAASAASKTHPFRLRGVCTCCQRASLASTCTCSPFTTVSTRS
jgi:hypothetical protein